MMTAGNKMIDHVVVSSCIYIWHLQRRSEDTKNTYQVDCWILWLWLQASLTELMVCKHRKENHLLSKHPFPVIVGHQQPKIMCKCINLCNCNNQRSQQRAQPVSKLPQGPRVRVNFSRVDERKPCRWAVASCWWAAGSQQDLSTEGCMAIYMNYPYYIEFLNSSLRKLRKNNKAHILQQNLFVAIKASEFIVLAWLLSILHLSICMTGSQLTCWTRQWVKTQVTRVDIGWEVYYGYIWRIFVWAPSFSIRILGGNIQVETDAGNSTGIRNTSCPLCTSIESALLTYLCGWFKDESSGH